MPSLSDETVTIAYPRSVTDEDAEAQLQHPTLWATSFVIRRGPSAVTGTEDAEGMRGEGHCSCGRARR